MFKCEEKGGKNSPNYISSSLRRTLNKTTKVPAHKYNLFCILNMWTIHRPRDYWSIILNHRVIYKNILPEFLVLARPLTPRVLHIRPRPLPLAGRACNIGTSTPISIVGCEDFAMLRGEVNG